MLQMLSIEKMKDIIRSHNDKWRLNRQIEFQNYITQLLKLSEDVVKIIPLAEEIFANKETLCDPNIKKLLKRFNKFWIPNNGIGFQREDDSSLDYNLCLAYCRECNEFYYGHIVVSIHGNGSIHIELTNKKPRTPSVCSIKLSADSIEEVVNSSKDSNRVWLHDKVNACIREFSEKLPDFINSFVTYINSFSQIEKEDNK